jgi:hypothetical protein
VSEPLADRGSPTPDVAASRTVVVPVIVAASAAPVVVVPRSAVA